MTCSPVSRVWRSIGIGATLPGRRVRGSRGKRDVGHTGRSVPACSATM